MKKERGILTLEAALVLSILMMAFFAIASYSILLKNEMTIQNALTQAAKESAQYGYLIEKLEIPLGGSEKTSAEELLENTTEFLSTIQLMGSPGTYEGKSFEEIKDSLEGSLSDLKGNVKEIRELLSDPKGLIIGFFKMMKGDLENAIVAEIGRAMFKNYVYKESGDVDATLENLGVVGGLDGISFSDSKMECPYLTFTVNYKMKGLYYDFFKIEHNIQQKAKIRLWLGSSPKSCK